MLNFSTDVQELISAQETVKRTSSFTEYTSKKKLYEAEILGEEAKNLIKELKNALTFTLHTGNRYLIITIYSAKEKKYSFLVVDLETLKCAEVDSIKNAKKGVMEIVRSNTLVTSAQKDDKEEKDEIVVEKVEESSKKNKK